MKCLLLLLLPMFGTSQSLFKTSIDSFTGEETTSLVNPIPAKGGHAKIDFIASTKKRLAIDISIMDNSMDCTFKKHMVRFLFIDNVAFSADNNVRGCSGHVNIILSGGPMMNAQLADKFRTVSLAAIRIEGDDRDCEFQITPAASAKIKAAAQKLFGNR